MDIRTSVHLGKRLHSQTCMLHFSAKHHTWRDISFQFISFQFLSSSRSIIQDIIFNLSILTISKIVLIEYATIILILTLSAPAKSDFGHLTSSNTQSRVHVRGCGLYPNATKSA